MKKIDKSFKIAFFVVVVIIFFCFLIIINDYDIREKVKVFCNSQEGNMAFTGFYPLEGIYTFECCSPGFEECIKYSIDVIYE